MYTKNQIIEVKIVDLSHDGEGIGKLDAFIWFIKDTVPGDVVEASVMKVKKTYGYARLQRVISPSPDRIQPMCPSARACGGCSLQAMSYEAQLKYKKDKVKNNLERIGGFNLNPDISEEEFGETIGMDDPWRYRNKAQYPIGTDRNGKVIAGFYAVHSHNIIECEDCMLGPAENRAIIDCIKKQYDPCMRHILIRKGFKTGQIMVCVVAGRKIKFTLPPELGVTTTVLNINDKDTNVILGDRTLVLDGPGYIEDYIGKLKFRISAQSFFQVNPIQVEKLYGKAVEFAGLTGNEIVWDLYCGIGTITLSLAENAKRVYGVEVVEQAIRDAEENAGLNGIENVKFYVGKAEEVIQRDDFEKPDVVVVDPPRKGCDGVCLETILKMQPDRIVYVSCDSATLARDLKILCEGGYRLRKVQPVDMFPQTGHVECVCL
ncbi:MAG: 23S rRNA (uracil(1939)-C(5))-methyltransferase RlmD, partial [Lachnospiraceae bacterium]|nr:23S rRNA (uracil(1939)-C(5))-methyltransferase RlmD [Lachnospiraceae bacterium]